MKLKVWLASLLLATVPAVAGAVTINIGDSVGRGVDATTDQSFIYELGGSASAKIDDFTLTFNSASSSNLNTSTWNLTAPFGSGMDVSFVPTIPGGLSAMINIPSFIMNPGETFTLSFVLVQPGTSGSFSFDVAPVPLPAAGWLLIAAVGGMGVLARRRSAA